MYKRQIYNTTLSVGIYDPGFYLGIVHQAPCQITLKLTLKEECSPQFFPSLPFSKIIYKSTELSESTKVSLNTLPPGQLPLTVLGCLEMYSRLLIS